MIGTARRTPAGLMLTLALALAALCSAPAWATDINVPADYASLQGAIDAASTGDTIHVAAGTYYEGLSVAGKSIGIVGAGRSATFLDGGGAQRVMLVHGDAEVSLTDLTLQNGRARGDSPMEQRGGAVYIDGGTVRAKGCTFTGNISDWDGGAVFNFGGILTGAECVFSRNRAVGGSKGAGILNRGTAKLTNCILTGNTTEASGCDYGGGICNFDDGTLITVNCSFSGNSAYSGGGIYNYGRATITNCIVWGNPGGQISTYYENATTTVSYSDIQGGAGGANNTNADPRFADAENGDLRLQAGSPCVDAGDNGAVTTANGFGDPPTDLEGKPRIADGNGDGIATVNAGALETAAPMASAGPDQVATVTHDGDPHTNSASIQLDGSASFDPDHGDLTYAWSEGGTELAQGVAPSVTLAEGNHTIRLKVTASSSGRTATDTIAVCIQAEANNDPVAEAGPDQAAAGNPVILDGSGSYDPDGIGDLLTFAWYDEEFNEIATAPKPALVLPVGTHTFWLIVTDPYGAGAQDTVSVTVLNTSPAPGAITTDPAGSCRVGVQVTAVAPFTDPDPGQTHTATWAWGDGTTSSGMVDDGGSSSSGSHTYAAPGTYTIVLTVSDGTGSGSSTLQYVVVSPNTAPAVTSIAAPSTPRRTGRPVAALATFSDPDIGDTHTATWEWGDGTTSVGTVSDVLQTVVGVHAYASAGVYTVKLTVTDAAGAAGSRSYQYTVVYDPHAGSVTGGGWIISPAGSYAANPGMVRKATFEISASYRRRSHTPEGETEFKLTGMDFHSRSYDWLVVSGTTARIRGAGTINGRGHYEFMVTAIDGRAGHGGADKFRIRIWNAAGVIYDNRRDSEGYSEDATVLGGGSIVIHR